MREGYGSAMLGDVANSVIGVDIMPDVVAHAERKHASVKIQFKVESCTRIPIPDASVDVVVSFETIEHHDQHDAMLAEIKRGLRHHGFMIISSPDRYEYSVVPNYQNPFHVKELDRQEFTQLLHANFTHVVMYGQRIVYGSGIFPDEGAAEVRCYQRQHSDLVAATGIPRPLYLIAIASDERVPERQGSIFEESLEASDFARSVIDERDSARTHHDRAVAEREQARAEREAAGIELETLRILAANQAQRILTLENSIGWRLLERYRQLLRSSAALSFLQRCLAGPMMRGVAR
jgi:SAM-dependent methyltransferase